jgi:hypothetical protein
MAQLNFNANEVEPSVGFDPIPAGKYLAVITESEMKATKAGTGQYLELVFEVAEGPYKGRKLWDRLNIHNPNKTAEQIAKGQLSALCRAVGVMEPRDSVELHGLPLTITVVQKTRSDTGEPSNEIKKYEKRDAVIGTPQQAAGGTPPWRRG